MRRIASLLIPALPLSLWYAYHYARTGYVFGNPEFFRYNVAATLSSTRFFLALAMRLWQIGRLSPFVGFDAGDAVCDVDAAAAARFRGERPRISVPAQMIFYVVMLAYSWRWR